MSDLDKDGAQVNLPLDSRYGRGGIDGALARFGEQTAREQRAAERAAARAAWTREYRARTGATTYTDTSKARARARRRLAEMYPTVYLALIAEERALLREVDS